MTEPARPAESRTATAPASRRRGRHWSLLGSVLGPFLALIAVVVVFGVADSLQDGGGTFLTVRNLQALSVQTAPVAVAALGMTVIIIAGGIDLSAGTAMALCATVLAWSLKEDAALLMRAGDNVQAATARVSDGETRLAALERQLGTTRRQLAGSGMPAARRERLETKSATLEAEQAELQTVLPEWRKQRETVEALSKQWTPWTPAVAVVLAVLTGCGCGLLNGAIVSALRVVPFIVTLGTMTFYLGVAKMLAEETTVRPDRATQVPGWLSDFLSIRSHALVAGFPPGVWLAIGLSIVLALVLRYTVFSRHVFAVGSNEATARLCGIGVGRTKVAVYAVGGLFVGIAGLYQFARLSVGEPTAGIGLELRVIAAVVIGGGSLSGGRGSVPGTLAGAAVMAVIASGCTQLGLRNPVQDIVLGVIIVAAVTLDQIRQRRLAAS